LSRHDITALPLAVALALSPLPAAAAELEEFFGQYVGRATLHEHGEGAVEERDVITSIDAFGDGGFEVRWSSVVLADGRRDRPGVRYLLRTLAFEPVADGAYYLRVQDYDPFKVRDELEPMAGDALAWAALADDTLDIYVFALTGDGAGELQHHRRELTEAGMRLAYTGLVDGFVETTGEGTLVRVGEPVDLSGP